MKLWKRSVIFTAAFVVPTTLAHASPLIVPGQQLGDIFIGQSDKVVIAKLKRPDESDAAMGKAWLFWNSKDSRQPNAKPNQLGVFTARNPDDTLAYVQQIRATSPYFHTANGISTASSLTQVKKAFPHLKRLETYKDSASGQQIEIYDDQRAGIAWQFVSGGRCLAITVHPKGRQVTAI